MPLKSLYEKPGHLIRRAQQIAVSIFFEECTEAEITPVQYAAMTAIRENPGVDATRLSDLVAFDRSTLGNVLERLEARGLIIRNSIASDKRVKALTLSREGEQVLVGVEPAVRRAQERILAPLNPEDRERFMEILTRLVELNNEASRAPLRAMAEPRRYDQA